MAKSVAFSKHTRMDRSSVVPQSHKKDKSVDDQNNSVPDALNSVDDEHQELVIIGRKLDGSSASTSPKAVKKDPEWVEVHKKYDIPAGAWVEEPKLSPQDEIVQSSLKIAKEIDNKEFKGAVKSEAIAPNADSSEGKDDNIMSEQAAGKDVSATVETQSEHAEPSSSIDEAKVEASDSQVEGNEHAEPSNSVDDATVGACDSQVEGNDVNEDIHNSELSLTPVGSQVLCQSQNEEGLYTISDTPDESPTPIGSQALHKSEELNEYTKNTENPEKSSLSIGSQGLNQSKQVDPGTLSPRKSFPLVNQSSSASIKGLSRINTAKTFDQSDIRASTTTFSPLLSSGAVRAVNPILEQLLLSIKLVEDNDESLKSLDLKDVAVFRPSHGVMLAKALQNNTHLESLNLSNTQLQTSTAIEIAKALEKNTGLKYLSLENNLIQPEGMREMAEMLKVNTTLLELNLSNQKYATGNYAEEAFASALARNNTLRKLILQIRSVAARTAIDRGISKNKKSTA